jgi:uridylate kinase
VIAAVDQGTDEILYLGRAISNDLIVAHQGVDGLYPGDPDPDEGSAL